MPYPLSGISGLSFDSPFLSPLSFFLSSFLAFSFRSIFFLLLVHSPDFLFLFLFFSDFFVCSENSQTFFVKS